MSKVKIKKVKVPIGSNDEVADIFNQMLGTGNVCMHMAYPRYLRMRTLCQKLVQLFSCLSTVPFAKGTDFGQEIAEFCQEATRQIAIMFSVNLDNYEDQYERAPPAMVEKFNEVYAALKKSPLMETFTIMCSNLGTYKKNFADLDKLDHRFILCMPGIEWCPFPFTSFNVKWFMCQPGLKEDTIRFMMTILGKAFELSYRLYKETQTPDVDIDRFADVIINNIDSLKKQPELSRCGRAFGKIAESITLLKNNFNDYYRDFVVTKDSTIIMQHFINDVATQSTGDLKLTSEFRRIIAYYRKVAGSRINDPNIKKLFDKVNENLEKEAGPLMPDSDEEESGDQEPAGENEITTITTVSSAAKTEADIL